MTADTQDLETLAGSDEILDPSEGTEGEAAGQDGIADDAVADGQDGTDAGAIDPAEAARRENQSFKDKYFAEREARLRAETLAEERDRNLRERPQAQETRQTQNPEPWMDYPTVQKALEENGDDYEAVEVQNSILAAKAYHMTQAIQRDAKLWEGHRNSEEFTGALATVFKEHPELLKEKFVEFARELGELADDLLESVAPNQNVTMAALLRALPQHGAPPMTAHLAKALAKKVLKAAKTVTGPAKQNAEARKNQSAVRLQSKATAGVATHGNDDKTKGVQKTATGKPDFHAAMAKLKAMAMH